MKSKITVTRQTDKWNSNKVWLIKHSSCGHYWINQEISGRIFYKAFRRTTKSFIQQALENTK